MSVVTSPLAFCYLAVGLATFRQSNAGGLSFSWQDDDPKGCAAMGRPGLGNHVKFKLLCRVLGEPRPHVRGYLELLWEVAYECGDPFIGNREAIEAAAEYPGPPGKLFEALLNCGGQRRTTADNGSELCVGFIEEVPNRPGTYQIHDLFDHAPDYVKKRQQREVERRNKNKRRKSNADGKNGGQRRTTADNGAPPAPGSRHPLPHPLPNTGSGKRAGVFSKLVTDDLRNAKRLVDWFGMATGKHRPVIAATEADLLRVFGAAEHAIEAGDNPPSLFAWLVAGKHWSHITAAQEDRAIAKLKAYRAHAATGPPPDSPAVDLANQFAPPTE